MALADEKVIERKRRKRKSGEPEGLASHGIIGREV